MQRNVTFEGFAPQTRLEPQFILSPENHHQYRQNRKSNETSTNNTNKLSGGGTGASSPPPRGRCFTGKAKPRDKGGDPPPAAAGTRSPPEHGEDGAAPTFLSNLRSPILSFRSHNCLQNHYSKYQNTTEATEGST